MAHNSAPGLVSLEAAQMGTSFQLNPIQPVRMVETTKESLQSDGLEVTTDFAHPSMSIYEGPVASLPAQYLPKRVSPIETLAEPEPVESLNQQMGTISLDATATLSTRASFTAPQSTIKENSFEPESGYSTWSQPDTEEIEQIKIGPNLTKENITRLQEIRLRTNVAIQNGLVDPTLYHEIDEDGETQLMICIREPEYTHLAWTLLAGTEPACLNMKNDSGQSALMIACTLSQITDTETQSNPDKETQTQTESEQEQQLVRAVRVLGADVSIQCLQGNTALHFATWLGRLDLLQAIFAPFSQEEIQLREKFGIEVAEDLSEVINIENADGKTALLCAVQSSLHEIVNFFLEQKANPLNFESSTGRNPLHLAVQHRDLRMVRQLLTLPNSDIVNELINKTGYDGKTALRILRNLPDYIKLYLRLTQTGPGQSHSPGQSESGQSESPGQSESGQSQSQFGSGLELERIDNKGLYILGRTVNEEEGDLIEMERLLIGCGALELAHLDVSTCEETSDESDED